MSTFFSTDQFPDLAQKIDPVYCPHIFSWLTLICYYHEDENDYRRPLLSVDNENLFIRDVIATNEIMNLDSLIESYEKYNKVLFISFNARMMKYIDLMAKIKPLGIKILCANKEVSTEGTSHLNINGQDMEFYYPEITPDCFNFDDAVKWFKEKHNEASVIEFSALAIRQLVALGKNIGEPA